MATAAANVRQILRDRTAVLAVIAEGLATPSAPRGAFADFRPTLECLYALAAENRPIPWPGLISDLLDLLAGRDVRRFPHASGPAVPPLLQQYEDLVLGKLYAEPLLGRMGEAVQSLPAAERIRGAAFVVHRVRERLQLPADEVSAGVLRGLIEQPAGAELQAAVDAALAGGLPPSAEEYLRGTIAACRRAADVLDVADALALERGTALLPLGQYLAHRQIAEASRLFREEAILPFRRAARPRQVAANLRDEDQYPIGGYSSISTRGSIESLLHSQLAYMEPAGGPQPDLFAIKFLRDELFYYARDENDFLRRRRSFRIFLHPSLAAARRKDAGAPAQRIVLALGWLDALVGQVFEKLNREALAFHIDFPGSEAPPALRPEWELLHILFRDGLQRGDVVIRQRPQAEGLAALARDRQTTATDALLLTAVADPTWGDVETHLIVDSATPRREPDEGEEAEGLERWKALYRNVLMRWLD